MVAMCHWCLGYVHVRVWGCEAAAYHLDSLGETPHPVIGTIRANKDYIRVSLYSYYTTITGWGVLIESPRFWRSQFRASKS